jgi:RHS repeat-associated protein
LVEARDDYVYVADPTFGHPRWLHLEVINAEASGYFLALPSQAPGSWSRVASTESRQVFGRGFPTVFEDNNDEGCPKADDSEMEEADETAPVNDHDPNGQSECVKCAPGAAGDGGECQDDGAECGTCAGKGLAVWKVSEPYISLWILDTPLYYTTSHGKRTAFTLTYKQRNTRPLDGTWGMGPRWESSRLTYVRYNSGSPYQVSLFAGQGGLRTYTPDGQARHYGSNTRMLQEGNSYRLFSPRLGWNVYGYAHVYFSGVTRYYQTQQVDKRGRITQLQHSLFNGIVRLNSIVDPDGRSVTLAYSPTYPEQLVEINDPYGRKAELSYNASGQLSAIQDVHGLTSQFTYAADGRLATLVTPYGTTTFTWTTDVAFGPYDEANRTLLVTEPGGRKHFYIYRNFSEYLNSTPGAPLLLPTTYPANQIPNTAPYPHMINTYVLYMVNSFYWGPGQYAGLSTAFKNSPIAINLTLADYKLARSRNWLLNGQAGEQAGATLNLERQPSPNGVLDGQKIWYDYEGKVPNTGHWWEGTQSNPQLVAMVLPDGTTRFTRYGYNTWGLPTQATTTYSNGGSVSTRTTSYAYDAYGKKLLSVTGPDGQLKVSYTYDTVHTNLIKTITHYRAAGQGYTTTYNYNSAGRLTSRVAPTGLTTTYTYTGDFLTQVTDSPVSRTESFTYDKGNVRTHTDYLGLTRTFTWNALQLLTRIDYGSDSTYETFGYTTLDRTSHRDRRGKITNYAYNGLRQLTSQTDPLGRVTTYGYCVCGSIGSITDPLLQVTSFSYDYTGRRTQVQLPGGGTFSYAYNLPGQMISATDALGTWTATYNHQGLLATIRNPASQVHHSVTYNIDDEPTSVTDAQNVVTTRTFDYLGRVLTRKQGTLPDEVFTYTARGLTNHTDQLGKLTRYTLDAALRKTGETTPNNETVTYTHNAAGNVLTLADHRGKTTIWTYDTEGRMLTKKYHGQTFANLEYTYNANSQVATRKFWSSASVNRQTSYGYDDVGNLTSVTYPVGTSSVTFGYNGRNQLSSMADSVFGTTTFDYTAAGLLSYEQPPWTSSRVTYGYNNALLRSQLTLQQPNLSWVQNYGYNSSRRLTSLTATSISGTPFAYTYLGASRRVSQITFPNNGKVVNSYDTLARLTATRLRRQDNVDLNKHEYVYNNRHERTKHTRFDNSYVDFGYDNLGQLTGALGYLSGGSPIANEQIAYTYDGGWNMTARTQNGAATTYTISDRNQATAISGLGSATFDINGNLTNRVYDATGPKTYNYFYDDENRLVEARTDTSSTPTASRWRSIWVYDGLSRARIKTDYTWSGSAWAVAGETRYLYDGRRVIQERNSSNTPTVTYTRGPDLSGSLEGAGGIGGLLARSHGYSAGTWSGHNYYHADGGGNITALLDNHATIAATSATYRYDPYGRLLASDGGMAAANIYRFSSKEVHPSSGLYYYGFRFYDPALQRWLNRDPLGETGGINLYEFVGNSPANYLDPLGLEVPAMDSVNANPSLACDLALQEAGISARGLNLASKLARNMAKAGQGVRQGDQAHHVIAESAKLARPARNVLKKFKIDVDSPANGVGLPKDFHASLHTKEYYDMINRMAQNWKSREEALEALRGIGNGLRAACGAAP